MKKIMTGLVASCVATLAFWASQPDAHAEPDDNRYTLSTKLDGAELTIRVRETGDPGTVTVRVEHESCDQIPPTGGCIRNRLGFRLSAANPQQAEAAALAASAAMLAGIQENGIVAQLANAGISVSIEERRNRVAAPIDAIATTRLVNLIGSSLDVVAIQENGLIASFAAARDALTLASTCLPVEQQNPMP